MKLIEPMLATLVHEPIDRPGWVYEEKYDGIRAMAYRRRRRVSVISRNLIDITDAFSEIADAIGALGDGDFVLDGEIVAFDRHDVSRFQLLQRRSIGEDIHSTFAVFDCLECNGELLVDRPLRDRRRAVESLVPERAGAIMRSRRLSRDGVAAYHTAERRHWEGIVAKDESSPYEAGRRSPDWLKVKCRLQSEFVIGGFTAPRGKRAGFGALLLGLYDRGRLRFTGKVGAGFAAPILEDLGKRMARLRTDEPAFSPPPSGNGVTWIRPKLVAQVAFAEWTGDGKLRQPVFQGLRQDKTPFECTWAERET